MDIFSKATTITFLPTTATMGLLWRTVSTQDWETFLRSLQSELNFGYAFHALENIDLSLLNPNSNNSLGEYIRDLSRHNWVFAN
jgi:hypothetical protein